MQLRKTIEEQTLSLKAMQDQVVRVSVERDNAIEECRRLRLLTKNLPSEKSRRTGMTRDRVTCQHDDVPPSTASSTVSKKKAASVSSSVTRRRVLMEANGGDEEAEFVEPGMTF